MSYNNGFIKITAAPTGSIYINGLTVKSTASNKTFIAISQSSSTTSYRLFVNSCLYNEGGNTSSQFFTTFQNKAYSSVDIFNCVVHRGGTGTIALIKLQTAEVVHFEDCMWDDFGDYNNKFIQCLNSAEETLFVKRIYCKTGADSQHTLDAGALLAPNITNEIFTKYLDTDLNTDHTGLAWSTDNFISIVAENPDYGVPQPLSTMTTEATQDTNIPENIIGLNGVTVGTRAAGCYTPNLYVLSPTGVTVTPEETGNRVSWTNTVQAEYPNTKIFWETVPAGSAFVTPKAEVEEGVTEFLVPFSQLATSPLWYTRLTHSE
jgi:hypothetical protein